MRARLARAATVAGLSVGVASVAVGALAITSEERREAFVDRFQPAADPEPRVLVIAVDPAFSSRIELDARDAMSELIQPLERAAIVVFEPDVNRLALTQLLLSDPRSAAQYAELAVTSLGNVVLASVPGPPAGSGENIPALDRPIPRTETADAAIATGFATPLTVDPGHPERTIPVVARPHGGVGPLVPALPVAAVLGLDGQRSRATLVVDEGEVVIGGRAVPVEAGSRLRVNYADELLPGGSQVLMASDVAGGRVDPARFDDAVVFLGVADPAYAQSFPSPVGGAARLPVVYVDANAASTVLAGEFLRAPSAGLGALVGLVAGLLVALAVALLPLPLAGVPMAVAFALVWRLGAARVGGGDPFDLLLALAGIGVAAAVALGWRVAEMAAARRRTAQLFSRYVPDAVARQLLATGAGDDAVARVRVATFFCDLRGFTPTAARLVPDEVRRLLDRYYEHVAGAVLDAGGTVMQFVGDEVFGVFGAPLPTTGPADALWVAQHLLDTADDLRDALVADGLPPIWYGIGLHVGPVVAAHVGTSRRRQYAVIGDTVNVGSRLCGQAPADGALLSEAFWIAADQPDAEPAGSLALKGVEHPVDVRRLRPRPAAAPDAPALELTRTTRSAPRSGGHAAKGSNRP